MIKLEPLVFTAHHAKRMSEDAILNHESNELKETIKIIKEHAEKGCKEVEIIDFELSRNDIISLRTRGFRVDVLNTILAHDECGKPYHKDCKPRTIINWNIK